MYNQSGIILLFQATWKWFAARPWSRYFAWTLTGLGLAIGCFGIYSTWKAGETVAVETNSSPVCSSPEPVSSLIVDVSGAVQNPGVYT
ncbi:hypothetical protein KBC79_06750, partial [Candidatus Woesebacteria bacterium]|nr:hypothetical protein [Candidatus Woesebacteria bacterium]